ncbi:MAG: PIG-L family deacetylase [Frankiaceae bacterium]|nr:PIG-L family deacetylase [Frankiaceae bacterium]
MPPPIGSAGLLAPDGTTTFRRAEGFDTSGITCTGANVEPDMEKVASLRPDLVVGYEFHGICSGGRADVVAEGCGARGRLERSSTPTSEVPMSTPALELHDRVPERVLAVVAHPDDLEYGAAALVARWTGAGAEVVYVLATRGEAGIDGMAPAEAARVRTQEQVASANVVGESTVEFLDHPDGTVELGLPLRRDLAVAIRRHRPDTVLLCNHRETWGRGRLNSPDHRHVGRAALEAIGDAGNRWIFPDAGGGLPPHGGVREALVCGSPLATHAADVTDTVDLAVASLAEHRA